MSLDVTVTCDGCKENITHGTPHGDERLVLVGEKIPTPATFFTGEFSEPKLARPAHFCNFGCLRKWLADQMERMTR